MAYTKDQLRNIFQNKFDREAWKTILTTIFGAQKVRRENELFTSPDASEVGYYLGQAETPDSFAIGLFYYKIESGSVAHKKVGLRNLVKGWINQSKGAFDAAIVVFDDNRDWRLSFVCDIKEEATAPKRFTFVFGEKDNFYRTAIDRFHALQTEKPTFENIRKAFSVDALSDDFFDEYRERYADFVEYITGKRYVKQGSKWVERVIDTPNYQLSTTFDGNEKLVRDYIKKMFGRIVFLYFLQRKGWLDGNRQYMHDLFNNSDNKGNFLDGVLEPLFFEVLNTDKPYRTEAAKALPGSESIPYLNGGLFARDEIDERTCIFPENLFKRLFDFLDSYNFTIDENDIDDAEIGIDPEMLGRIFENLLEDNKDKGAFYTPKEIVDYMCRESIIAYLIGQLPEINANAIRELVEHLNPDQLSPTEQIDIRRKLQAVKICDPAIGSGAFPMGLVNLLSKLYVAMKADTDTAKMKRHIMEQNIYGVDIERGAVDIARLRFWLAMIVEEKEPMPLPNLHFKIMQGNSLLESYNGVDLSDLTKISGQSSLFDSDNSEREALISNLKSYYTTSDHTKRDLLFNDITKNVRRQLYDKGITLPKGTDPSANTDFFLWHTWFTDVFANGGFDIVIGNPPYIQLQNNSSYLANLYEGCKFESFTRTGDIYCLFYEQGWRILKNGGQLCYITSNKWMRAGYGKDLRQFFTNRTNPELLIDFGGIQIFDNATVDTNILLFSKESNRHETKAVSGSKQHKDILKNLSVFVRQNFVPTDFASSDSWVILSPIEQSIKRKIEAVGVPLKDWDIQINYGIKTGFNDAFIITTEKRNEILSNCADDDERKRTEELIRPILRGRDIKRYGYDWKEKWVILAYFGSYKVIPSQYPAIYEYLLKFEDALKARGQVRYTSGGKTRIGGDYPGQHHWLELDNNPSKKYLDDFLSPKIIWAELSRTGNSFAVDDNQTMLGNTGFTLNFPNNTVRDLYYLLSFLNSKVCLYQMDKLTTRFDDNGWRWLRQFVELIRIPFDKGNNELSEIAKQTNRENQIVNSKIINQIVYCSYGLSEDECNYIENELIGF